MQYLIIWLVLLVIFGVAVTILATSPPVVCANAQLTKQDKLIIAVLSLAASALSTGALWIILNY